MEIKKVVHTCAFSLGVEESLADKVEHDSGSVGTSKIVYGDICGSSQQPSERGFLMYRIIDDFFFVFFFFLVAFQVCWREKACMLVAVE